MCCSCCSYLSAMKELTGFVMVVVVTEFASMEDAFGAVVGIASAEDGWVITAASTWIAGSVVATAEVVCPVYREKLLIRGLLLLLAMRKLGLMKTVVLRPSVLPGIFSTSSGSRRWHEHLFKFLQCDYGPGGGQLFGDVHVFLWLPALNVSAGAGQARMPRHFSL